MILISACLGGERVRYDAGHCLNVHLRELVAEGKAVMACPEMLGGLPTPREAAEIQWGCGEDVLDGNARVMTSSGKDATKAYLEGAYRMLEIAKQVQATCVILKENSPSCGVNQIYDGTFDHRKVEGMGVTAALLKRHGFTVMSEEEYSRRYLEE